MGKTLFWMISTALGLYRSYGTYKQQQQKFTSFVKIHVGVFLMNFRTLGYNLREMFDRCVSLLITCGHKVYEKKKISVSARTVELALMFLDISFLARSLKVCI